MQFVKVKLRLKCVHSFNVIFYMILECFFQVTLIVKKKMLIIVNRSCADMLLCCVGLSPQQNICRTGKEGSWWHHHTNWFADLFLFICILFLPSLQKDTKPPLYFSLQLISVVSVISLVCCQVINVMWLEQWALPIRHYRYLLLWTDLTSGTSVSFCFCFLFFCLCALSDVQGSANRFNTG